jgi:hypothetical protein
MPVEEGDQQAMGLLEDGADACATAGRQRGSAAPR